MGFWVRISGGLVACALASNLHKPSQQKICKYPHEVNTRCSQNLVQFSNTYAWQCLSKYIRIYRIVELANSMSHILFYKLIVAKMTIFVAVYAAQKVLGLNRGGLWQLNNVYSSSRLTQAAQWRKTDRVVKLWEVWLWQRWLMYKTYRYMFMSVTVEF